MTKHIFKSAGVDMASVYLNLQKHVYRLLYSVAAVYDSINTCKISFEHSQLKVKVRYKYDDSLFHWCTLHI